MGAGTAAFARPPAPPVPTPAISSKPALSGCQTARGSVHFDFEGASRSVCYVEDERTISILVTPEHVPPINPSPWYAFRYTAADDGAFTVHVRYLGVRHRYVPKWRGRGDPAALSVNVANDGSTVSITLPAGEGVVSGQPLLTAAHYDQQLAQLADIARGHRIRLGSSHDGRAVEAIHLGYANAPRLVILLGRQHPPEVTGAMAMDAFSQTIAKLVGSGAIDPATFQFLIVPLLNPDGVARGHWRANLGGVDINRDWGPFEQPETRAVADWLSKRPAGVKPVLMLDFHSTNRNLFYVQGEEASAQAQRFLASWLGGKETAFEGYSFSIEPRDANPGSATAKNWFKTTYAIPAYTYEVGDQTDPEAIRTAAEALAQTMIPALVSALETSPAQ
jgi:hypothetical protein